MTNTTTRTVRVTTYTTGRNFGHVGQALALNGRSLWESATYPTAQAARIAAEDHDRRNGWTVR
jgi:hypothetical protein